MATNRYSFKATFGLLVLSKVEGNALLLRRLPLRLTMQDVAAG
jgi:hypothetical protein